MKRTLITTGLAALLGSTALAQDLQIAEVDVTADLTVIEDPQGAEFWGSLEEDLESAIRSRIVERIADEGARLVVDIVSFALPEAMGQPFDVETAALSARVHVIDLTNNANFDSYELSVSLQGMTAVDADGVAIPLAPMDSEVSYQMIVDAFADNVVERLD